MSFVAGKGRGLLGRNQVLDRIGCNSVGAVTNPPSPDFDELPGVRGVKRSGTCALVPIAPEKLL